MADKIRVIVVYTHGELPETCTLELKPTSRWMERLIGVPYSQQETANLSQIWPGEAMRVTELPREDPGEWTFSTGESWLDFGFTGAGVIYGVENGCIVSTKLTDEEVLRAYVSTEEILAKVS